MAVFYRNIYINLPYDTVKHIIGKNGYNFTKMSEKFNLNCIWYNKDTNAITIYGPKEHLDEAEKNVKKVIEGYTKKFSNDFIDNIYNTNTMNEICTELSLKNVLDIDQVKHLIGQNGFSFKQITRKANVYFIWYDNESHVIKIWGTEYHTLKAIKMIHESLYKVQYNINKYTNANQSNANQSNVNQSNVEHTNKRKRTF